MLRAMAWKKSPAALVEAFDAVVPAPPAERRQMFGYPAAFVNVGDRAALKKWAAKALTYGQSLPPKPKKPAKNKAPATNKPPAKNEAPAKKKKTPR